MAKDRGQLSFYYFQSKKWGLKVIKKMQVGFMWSEGREKKHSEPNWFNQYKVLLFEVVLLGLRSPTCNKIEVLYLRIMDRYVFTQKTIILEHA